MATRIEAVTAYCPRIVLQDTAEMKQLVRFISRSTGLNESGVRHVLLELRDAVAHFAIQGRPVKLEGLGIYTPIVKLDGTFGVRYRADIFVKQQLNAPRAFEGTIKNLESVGKTSDDLVSLWNEEHPQDPVVN
jgi:hypothetical protein